jgi:DNA polymerase elongation subunit (family B)
MSKTYNAGELHGKVIKYSQLKHMPTRNAFLEPKIFARVSDDISTGNTLLFMPNGIHEAHLQEKKYDKSKYSIVLFGVLLDGRKATVVVSGIKPYFEVMIPNDLDAGEFATNLYNNLKQKKYAYPESYEIIKGRKFRGHQSDRRSFVKFTFDKLKMRQEAIKDIRTQGYETTSDDTSSYYRMVCRDYLTTFSSWVNISEYHIRTYPSLRGAVYKVDIKNFIKSDIDITTDPRLSKDNLMSCCWDIETYSPDGQLPRPENPDHKMFMIGITFQWHHANDQLLRVCLIDHPCDPRPNYLTIVCDDEKKLIKAFGKLIFKMKPDFNLGFNDSDYDWPWLIKRAKEYAGTLAFLAECFDCTVNWKNYDDNDVFTYNYKKEKVKIEADVVAFGYTLVFPGYINIDVRTIFRQLYPTAEKSNLNFYLALNKLGGKKDMPYQELFRIYREMDNLMKRRNDIKQACSSYKGLIDCYDDIVNYTDNTEYKNLKDQLAEIADYCIIDSQRCHELMKIRSVIMDRREVAVMSYTTMFDALYRANGMKVRNLVIARGQSRGLKFSNITNSGEVEKGKYPGAYVFPPKKGIVTSKLTIKERIDQSTLIPQYAEWLEISQDIIQEYYEIITMYGTCLDMKIINSINEERTKSGKKMLRKCFIDFLLEKTGRPITGLDFSSLYPSLIMTYNLSPEYIITGQKEARQAQADGNTLYKIKFNYNGRIVRGWSIRHDNKIDPKSPNCKFGVYPMILKELFDTRKLMKKGLHKWEGEKERLETLSREEFMKPEIQEEYETVCFNYSYIDSKQKALKVFMNTFYGESGNKRSPFFVLQLAGAITTSGQDNIKMVHRYVESIGCGVFYGDSVTGDTPLMLRNRETKQVMIKTIDDLSNDWKSYDQFKPGEPDRICKQQAECSYEIWTEGDWHDIRRVIRHKTNKKMYRVNTHIGCIDVTADHSLLKPDRTQIKPSELEVGVALMHSFPTEFPEILETSVEKKYEQVHCSRCNSYKPYYEFYKKRTGSYLKPCRKCCWTTNSRNRDRSYMTRYFSEYEYLNSINPITKEEAYVWGLFMADGSCGNYQCPSGLKSSWVINNQNIRYLNQAKDYLEICEPNLKFKLIDTLNSSGVHKLVATERFNSVKSFNVKLLVGKYSQLFYDKHKYKLVPSQILNGSREIRQSFHDGYYVGAGCKPSEQNNNMSEFCCKGKITSQCMYYLVKSLGYKYVSISVRNDKPDIYSFRITHGKFKKNPHTVKKILHLPEVAQDMFVYDIETSKGSFNGGVGAITAKNTDSLYIAMPEKYFTEIDKQYFTGQIDKLAYWVELVNITFKTIKPINKEVNDILMTDNGTDFLKMAYEEALYPVAFLAKKKYYGIPHISIPNFQPKELFIKGLEVKKRGVSEFLRKVCMNIMWDSVNITNIYSLMQLVEKKIDEIYETNWDFKDFIMTDVFKPIKKNVKVHTFVQRMLDVGLKVKPYERFSYVIVKKNPFKYDDRGRKKSLSIGEKMEYSNRASEMKMEIDLDYYMKGSINGQLSRLIVYHDLFHVEPVSEELDDLKSAEDKIYANSCKYIENYCDKYFTKYQSKGKIYQKIFRMANSAVVENLKQHCGKETVALLNGNYDIENLEEWLEKKSEKDAIRAINGYGKEHVDNIIRDLNKKDKQKKIKELQEVYFSNKKNNLLKIREASFKERRTLLHRHLNDNIVNIISVLNYNTNSIIQVSSVIKEKLNIDNMYNNANEEVPDFDNIGLENIDSESLDDIALASVHGLFDNEKLFNALNKLRYIYINMLSNYNYIHKTRYIVDHLKILRNASIKFDSKPKSFNVNKYIQTNVDDIIKSLKTDTDDI